MSSLSGKYVRKITSNYCVVDVETTGLSAYYDEVIEIGILRVRDNEIVDRYQQLLRPQYAINPAITSLTGITNAMVAGMPRLPDIKTVVLDLIGDDVIVGHNTSFDLRFLNAGFHSELQNEYVDTLQLARKVYPELPHHRLSDLTRYLDLHTNMHRSLADCVSTKELYDAIKDKMARDNLTIDDLWAPKRSYGCRKGAGTRRITAELNEIEECSFFQDRHVAFTGKLEKMARKDAMQLVVTVGGILDNSVIKNTNYLILGDNDYNAILKGKRSSKHKKAEKLKLDGQDIEVLDELTFYDILGLR